jgi:hypothetical protein
MPTPESAHQARRDLGNELVVAIHHRTGCSLDAAEATALVLDYIAADWAITPRGRRRLRDLDRRWPGGQGGSAPSSV